MIVKRTSADGVTVTVTAVDDRWSIVDLTDDNEQPRRFGYVFNGVLEACGSYGLGVAPSTLHVLADLIEETR